MGHGKETPRQKMIGMMYLVLTALLALNVSKDVLNAFILVNAGLTKTTQNFFEKNEALYGDFEEAYQLNPVKVQDWKTRLAMACASGSLANMRACPRNMLRGN